MRKIFLGSSGVPSSIIGLGCMSMSEFYGKSDDAVSLKTLARALELGVTHFDTSNVYGRGHNEELIGQFARGRRDALTIASKFGVVRDPDGPLGSSYDRGVDNSTAYMRQCCEDSLRRLGTDRIDVYYVHRADPARPIEDTVGAMADLITEGKIRAIGLSEVTEDQLRRAHATHPIATLQSEYSLWSREAELDTLPACRELGITFVAYSPLGRGFLTGGIRQASDLEADDIRRTSPRFQDENLERNQEILSRLNAFCEKKACTPGQLALAWILHQKQDIVPIPGTKRIAYLEENVRALDVTLNDAEMAKLSDLLPIGIAAGDRYAKTYGGAPKAPVK